MKLLMLYVQVHTVVLILMMMATAACCFLWPSCARMLAPATPSAPYLHRYKYDSSKKNKHAFFFAIDDDSGILDDGAEWTPRSRHWINDEFFEQETAAQLRRDLQVQVVEEEKEEGPGATEIVTTLHRNKDGNAIAVEISSALTEDEAAGVESLAQSVRVHLGDDNFEHRSFGEEKGGNNCIYLAPLLQVFRPDIALKVITTIRLAWKDADWDRQGYPDPFSLGVRTSEFLSYQGWKSLEAHKDVGSVYTAMIAMADPRDYHGGEFFIHNSFYDSTDIKPQRFSAIVFLSNTTHGVRRITSGLRQSFVTELWTQDDAPLRMNRPTPEEWQAYVIAPSNSAPSQTTA